MLGWSYYGDKSVEYLFGDRLVKPYRFVFCIFIFIGAYTKLDLVWAVADVFNGLMAIPNLIALLALSKVVVQETNRHYPG
jgi:AGCS family alanine or glycine:cation symporter